MNKRGSLWIPFTVILSLFSLLLGGLAGNIVGRVNQAKGDMSVLDLGAIKTDNPRIPSPKGDPGNPHMYDPLPGDIQGQK